MIQILTNDDKVCIPCLSSILLAVCNAECSNAHLSKQGERHQLQYTSVNLLEIDADIFIDTRFSKKCMTYGRILEKY